MNKPLHVLELGDGVASAYAARLLADNGAEVIKVEPPHGDSTRRRGPYPADAPDPEHSGLFLPLNLNKRGVVLARLHADDPTMDNLLRWADVLIHDMRASTSLERSLDADTLTARYPSLITLSITAFGSVDSLCHREQLARPGTMY